MGFESSECLCFYLFRFIHICDTTEVYSDETAKDAVYIGITITDGGNTSGGAGGAIMVGGSAIGGAGRTSMVG